MSDKKTAIVTGASQGIGAGLVEAFLKEGYNVVATSRDVSQSFTTSPHLVLIDGDIGKQGTASKCIAAAMRHFGSIDVLVNNAGIFRTKPFTDFTTEDFNALVSTNLLGFLYITQFAVQQMLKQKSGNVVTISASLADQPVAGIHASVSMMTKGGLNTVTRSLAIEYAKDGIRFNAVPRGICPDGNPCPYTVSTRIIQNTVRESDVGVWLSNADASFNPPTSATNIKVVNNVLSNTVFSNVSGCGSPLGYQAGVSDEGNNDKIVANSISGAGYSDTGSGGCGTFSIDTTVTARAKVDANTITP